ncbi:MAG: T9SS type A sorting domain-containing protein [Flavobacteriaceae bacterium]
MSEVNVINIVGQKLEVPVFAENTQIKLSGLSAGNYLVQVKINESVKTFKIVRQ